MSVCAGSKLIEMGLEAVAYAYHLLLFWSSLARFYIPPFLLVSVFCILGIGWSIDVLYFLLSMRYSRMLEESSFANKRADYLWLLLLSSLMLLVRPDL